MNVPRLPLLLALAVVFVLAGAATASAATLSVPSGQYPTIQAAVDAAASDDVIEVAAGIYREQVTIRDKTLVLKGAGADATFLKQPAIYATPLSDYGNTGWTSRFALLGIFGSSVTVSDLTIDGESAVPSGTNSYYGVLFLNSDGALRDAAVVHFRHATRVGNWYVRAAQVWNTAVARSTVAAAQPARDVTVERVTFSDFDDIALFSLVDEGGSKPSDPAVTADLTVHVNDNTVVGAGPISTSQNAFQVGASLAYAPNSTLTGEFTGNQISDLWGRNGWSSSAIVEFRGASGVEYVGNTITNAQSGLAVASPATISGNSLDFTWTEVPTPLPGKGECRAAGIQVYAGADGATVVNNSVAYDEIGLWWEVADGTIAHNSFVPYNGWTAAAEPCALYVGSGTAIAAMNWWGQQSGSASGQVFGPATTAPWISAFTPDPDKAGATGFWPTAIITGQTQETGESAGPATNAFDEPGLGSPSITFASVETAGTTELRAADNPTADDQSMTPFTVAGSTVFFDLSTTAAVTGPYTIRVATTDPSARLWHYEDGAWIDVTDDGYPADGCVQGTTNSLSPFVVAAEKAASSTALTSSANPSTYGDSVTFTAAVTPAGATGSVTFYKGGTKLDTVALSEGSASYMTGATQLAAGSHSITAVYSGDEACAESTADALTQVVQKKTVTVTIANRTIAYGQPDPEFTSSATGFLGQNTWAVGPVLGIKGDHSKAGTYAIVATIPGDPGDNYTAAYVNGTLTVTPRQGAQAMYTGQLFSATRSATTTAAQVTLTASITDPTQLPGGTLADARVTFTDLISAKVIAKDVPVSLVGGNPREGIATTIATLSAGQNYTCTYVIRVSVQGSYQGSNSEQLANTPESATVTVQVPSVTSSLMGDGSLAAIANTTSLELGTEGTLTSAMTAGDRVLYSFGFTYTKKGTPKGQAELLIPGPDGSLYYIKSNSITSVTANLMTKTATVYTKASVAQYKADGTSVGLEGAASLRIDMTDTGEKVGFTLQSSKTSALLYSNDWYKSGKTWLTRQQAAITSGFVTVR